MRPKWFVWMVFTVFPPRFARVRNGIGSQMQMVFQEGLTLVLGFQIVARIFRLDEVRRFASRDIAFGWNGFQISGMCQIHVDVYLWWLLNGILFSRFNRLGVWVVLWCVSKSPSVEWLINNQMDSSQVLSLMDYARWSICHQYLYSKYVYVWWCYYCLMMTIICVWHMYFH